MPQTEPSHQPRMGATLRGRPVRRALTGLRAARTLDHCSAGVRRPRGSEPAPRRSAHKSTPAWQGSDRREGGQPDGSWELAHRAGPGPLVSGGSPAAPEVGNQGNTSRWEQQRGVRVGTGAPKLSLVGVRLSRGRPARRFPGACAQRRPWATAQRWVTGAPEVGNGCRQERAPQPRMGATPEKAASRAGVGSLRARSGPLLKAGVRRPRGRKPAQRIGIGTWKDARPRARAAIGVGIGTGALKLSLAGERWRPARRFLGACAPRPVLPPHQR